MSVRIEVGDAIERLRELPDHIAHCCVTSPPYFGLRDYGVDGQIGLEDTTDAYVAKLVEVFREVRRVLRDDGTLWLNLGDSYAGSWGAQSREHAGKHAPNVSALSANQVKAAKIRGSHTGSVYRTPDCKSKDLIGIPWMGAFALRADGWYLRDEIVWHKLNPMPESVTDRCTSAHEKVFMLAKSKRYYFDSEAIAEEATGRASGNGFDREHRLSIGGRGRQTQWEGAETRNRRNVWSIPTQPFRDAHFAVMAPRLAQLCISAGTSEKGCCKSCGSPWVRAVKRERTRDGEPLTGSFQGNQTDQKIGATGVGHWRDKTTTTTVGWHPSCECGDSLAHCVVLDPFGGAGTTGLVADRLQRNAILIELNPTYAEIARRRIENDANLLTEVV